LTAAETPIFMTNADQGYKKNCGRRWKAFLQLIYIRMHHPGVIQFFFGPLSIINKSLSQVVPQKKYRVLLLIHGKQSTSSLLPLSHFIWAHARIAIKLFSELSILDLLFFPSSYREHNYMSIWITKYYYSWNNRFYSHVHEWNVIMTTSAGLIQFICSASREVWSRCLI